MSSSLGKIFISFFLLFFGIINSVFTQNLVQDSSFEAGYPNNWWVEHSTNFSHLICNNTCGNAPGVKPRTGTHFVWLGGSAAQVEIGRIYQYITIPSGKIVNLSFFMKTPTVAPNLLDYFQVVVDSTVIFNITSADSAYYKYEYREVNIDISAFADGGSHKLKFRCYQTASLGVTNYLLDDISVSVSTGINDLSFKLPFSLFPQPANELLNIAFASNLTAEISLLSISGERVLSETIINGRNFKLNTSNLKNGVYILQIINMDGILQRKISIIH